MILLVGALADVGRVPHVGPCGPTNVPFAVLLAATDAIPREFEFRKA